MWHASGTYCLNLLAENVSYQQQNCPSTTADDLMLQGSNLTKKNKQTNKQSKTNQILIILHNYTPWISVDLKLKVVCQDMSSVAFLLKYVLLNFFLESSLIKLIGNNDQ